MRIKSRYYTDGVFPKLQKDIDLALKPFPGFRQELFDKLYDFFHRYFSPSGSIYFQHTPAHKNIYEKVYTDDRDVVLFWKTHMLYYVKTDRLFNSLEVEVDDRKFFFDASTLEHKRANEKRELVYEFTVKREDGVLVFATAYSEKGRKTKLDDIMRQLHKLGVEVKEEAVERAFRVFERQSEVDYFINKNAKAFLREQFDLWLYQYVFSGESEWTEPRIKQLQVLKDIALKVIDFISQFEDELVRIWNKPKFVLNSNYVITLDRIAAKDTALVERLLKHDGMKEQIQEWRDLGIIGDDFRKTQILASELHGKVPAKQWRFLPFDTKHFKDLELEILGLFDHLDDELDGWLIKSENYQALNTLQSRLREQIKCIHIDPPYNTDSTEFYYANRYQHSSWLTMMRDRLLPAIEMLRLDGSLLCHIDENEQERLHLLLEESPTVSAGTLVWDRGMPVTGAYGLATQHEYILWRMKEPSVVNLRKENVEAITAQARSLLRKYGAATEDALAEYRAWLRAAEGLSPGELTYTCFDERGRPFRSDNMSATDKRQDPKFHRPLIHPDTGKPCPVPDYGWRYAPNTMDGLLGRGLILFGKDHTTMPRKITYLDEHAVSQMPSIIKSGFRGKVELDALGLGFPFAHSTELYETLLKATCGVGRSVVLDHFGGSGTSMHAVINLNREDGSRHKYILVEMADYFDTVIVPRAKKAVFCKDWKDGRAAGGPGVSHFVKYFQLEQYEDCLRRAKYEEADLFDDPNQDPYNQYVFLRDPKLLDAVKVDTKKNKVQVDLSRLYKGIDLPETLSNLTGKRIRRIKPDSVEFEDGTVIDLAKQDFEFFKLVKPMVWW
jgi:adenine-specific DNA-methyltransferase